MGLAIETTGLVKTFGAQRAVDGVELAVPAGTVYGVLGPNGAGKTTTVRMLATLLRPDAGRALALGHRTPAARERAARLLEVFGLTGAARRQVKNYSGGMRRRLDIAAGIVSIPELLLLEQPTTGLDPRSRNQVWDIVHAAADPLALTARTPSGGAAGPAAEYLDYLLPGSW